MLSNFKEVTYSPLATAHSFQAKLDGTYIIVKSNIDHVLKTKIEQDDSSLVLSVSESNTKDFTELMMVTTEYALGHMPSVKYVTIKGLNNPSYPLNLFKDLSFERAKFFQIPTLWHQKSHINLTPERWTETEGRQHPVRDLPHSGTVYKRYVPEIQKTISFRQIELSKDLDIFHEWHNQDRVLCFWELNKPKDELKAYIEKGLKDPHQFPMIVEIDNEMVGYYEMYWVKEDRLGPYYESEAWDRGFHFLIGNTKFLGYANTDSIIKSGLHFMYLDDLRTRKVMAEPRHDNQKVLKYAESSKGWRKVKEFDFPHKRAALLENKRESFFGGNAL